MVSRTRVEQAKETRRALVAAARRLFVAKGYPQTGTEEIVAAAGVGTRGALYHHFEDKEALFVAVFEEIQAELREEIPRRLPAGTLDALARLRAMLAAFLDCVRERRDAQAMLVDGPAALGWRRFRDVEARYGLVPIQALLNEAAAEGTIGADAIPEIAHLLLALVDDAALLIATASNRRRAHAAARSALLRILDGLR